jgi:putative ABC transport system permease protein
VHRAILKGLLARKLRLLLTALSITLGVAFVAGTFVLTDTMSYTFDHLFENVTQGVDVSVRGRTPFAGVGEPVPESVVEDVRSVAGVRFAEGSVTGLAQLIDPDGEAIATRGAPTLGLSWMTRPELRYLTLRTGEAPRKPGQVVIDAATAETHGFEVGDEITILFQGPPEVFEIVGVAGFGAADSLAGATVAAFETETAQRVLGTPGGFTTIDVTGEPGVGAAGLEARLRDVVPSGFEVVTGTDLAKESADQVKEGLGFFQTGLLVFAGISLFVGAFTIFNTFSITVAQRSRELALLRTMGASPGQVRRSVLAESLAVGLVASAAGVVLGVVGSVGLTKLLDALGLSLPVSETQILPRTVLVSIAVGLLVAAVSSLVPAQRAAGVHPIEALRDAAPSSTRTHRRRTLVGGAVIFSGAAILGWGLVRSGGAALTLVGAGAVISLIGVAALAPALVRPLSGIVGWPLLRLRGLPGRLARDNAMRNPNRTAATTSALMIGLAMVTLAAVFTASVKATSDETIDATLRSDFILSADTFGSFSPEVARALQDRPEIGAVTEVRAGTLRYRGRPTFLTATEPDRIDDVMALDVIEGDLAGLGAEDVGVRANVADEAGLAVGDRIEVKFARTGRTDLNVGAIYERNALVADFITSLATYERNFVEQLDSTVFVDVAGGVRASEARSAVEEEIEAFPNVKVYDQAELKAEYSNQVDRLLGIVYALLGLAILIGLFGIVNTLALSVFERTRELRLLRAVGMTRAQVKSAIRWESVIIAVIGAVFGSAVGTAFGWAIVSNLEDITHVVLPAGQMLVYLVFAGAAGILAAIAPARRAAKVDVLRAVTVE